MLAPYSIDAAFSAVECGRIADLAALAPEREAALVGGHADPGRRRAEIAWLDEAPDTAWVMDRIVALVRQSNRERFGFDLTDFSESPQVARYRAAREGHFDWHADIGDGRLAARRKLTLVVQLSEPGAYDGGRLEIMPSAAVLRADKAQGSAVLFPAFLLHRVTPVTRGERLSLTIWAHGPAFR